MDGVVTNEPHEARFDEVIERLVEGSGRRRGGGPRERRHRSLFGHLGWEPPARRQSVRVWAWTSERWAPVTCPVSDPSRDDHRAGPAGFGKGVSRGSDDGLDIGGR